MIRLHVLRWREVGRQGGFARRGSSSVSSLGSPLIEGGFGSTSSSSTTRSSEPTTFASLRPRSFYLSGRDPRLAKASIGLLMHAYAIQEAHEEAWPNTGTCAEPGVQADGSPTATDPLEAVAVPVAGRRRCSSGTAAPSRLSGLGQEPGAGGARVGDRGRAKWGPP